MIEPVPNKLVRLSDRLWMIDRDGARLCKDAASMIRSYGEGIHKISQQRDRYRKRLEKAGLSIR